MTDSTPERLRFPPVSNLTVRADFEGGALSSDFGPLILQGVNRQTGLIEQLAGAVRDTRHGCSLLIMSSARRSPKLIDLVPKLPPSAS